MGFEYEQQYVLQIFSVSSNHRVFISTVFILEIANNIDSIQFRCGSFIQMNDQKNFPKSRLNSQLLSLGFVRFFFLNPP